MGIAVWRKKDAPSCTTVNEQGSPSQGLCFSVRNGQSIQVWNDRRIPHIGTYRPKPRDGVSYTPNDVRVSDLIDHSNRVWKEPLIRSDANSSRAIFEVHLSRAVAEDNLILAPDSLFSVKSAYLTDQADWFSDTGPLSKQEWKKLWAVKSRQGRKLSPLLRRGGQSFLKVREMKNLKLSGCIKLPKKGFFSEVQNG